MNKDMEEDKDIDLLEERDLQWQRMNLDFSESFK